LPSLPAKVHLTSATVTQAVEEDYLKASPPRPLLPPRQKKTGPLAALPGSFGSGVTGYRRNILLCPTGPKPNRQASTHNNTAPPDTRWPKRCVRVWAGFFME
jgi:hypothetical protein